VGCEDKDDKEAQGRGGGGGEDEKGREEEGHPFITFLDFLWKFCDIPRQWLGDENFYPRK
jgi:hypothetical protein